MNWYMCKLRCNDIKRQNLFASIRDGRSLVCFCDMKFEWTRETHSLQYKKWQKWLAWFKTGTWKLKGTKKGFENERCPLCRQEEDASHILLKCSETRNWRWHSLTTKWHTVDEEVACKIVIKRTNAVESGNIGNYLDKIRCKSVNKICNIGLNGKFLRFSNEKSIIF
jgi:hypothetical protein